MRSQRVLSIAVALLACGLAGCSDVSEPSSGKPTAINQQTYHLDDRDIKEGEDLQNRLMADGSVSRSDYEQAVKAVGECFARYNLRFTDEGWDPVGNQTIDFTFGNPELSDDEVLGYGDGCQKVYLERIQESFVASSEPVMDPAILKASQNCLSKQGIQTTRNETNIEDLVASAGKAAFDDVLKCVKESAQTLHPNRSLNIGV
ncbi:hypothetical protein FHR83_004023 [Actinoplanes campanulatus]|uniref:Lipoprotein n=1 Tax=Actinoplanes campanulatus TaxID=113559 RepID=A0A7W5FF90_9ACTN|nr:hypothetical protein [Actinoplanes campanulatus]MBB3096353.1 hypothetical protein [Actinoplanes campanulatus]GGN18842.1 hypothetical protein GCM10010109_32160 [Actinoplanes campanulatus]GID38420.1 hypothetical protein Aca09nite_49260 [Actinoplanes campanulatus]